MVCCCSVCFFVLAWYFANPNIQIIPVLLFSMRNIDGKHCCSVFAIRMKEWRERKKETCAQTIIFSSNIDYFGSLQQCWHDICFSQSALFFLFPCGWKLTANDFLPQHLHFLICEIYIQCTVHRQWDRDTNVNIQYIYYIDLNSSLCVLFALCGFFYFTIILWLLYDGIFVSRQNESIIIHTLHPSTHIISYEISAIYFNHFKVFFFVRLHLPVLLSFELCVFYM